MGKFNKKGNFHRKMRMQTIKKTRNIPHRLYDELGIEILENPDKSIKKTKKMPKEKQKKHEKIK